MAVGQACFEAPRRAKFRQTGRSERNQGWANGTLTGGGGGRWCAGCTYAYAWV